MKHNARRAPCLTHDAAPCFDPAFAHDVLVGLSNEPKSIPGTWLYDRTGSGLLEAITRLPAYYPARTETLILQRCAGEIGVLAGAGASLIELGRGSSPRTALLLAALEAPACYAPIDSSVHSLHESVGTLKAQFPTLPIRPVIADFTRLSVLPPLPAAPGPRVMFFPGSTIGKLAPDEAVALLRNLGRLAGAGGLLVLGVDPTQDPSRLLAAYDDPQGVTAAFNKNLLVRMNRELGADFDVDSFRHAARVDTRQRRVEMHLVSRCEQWVQVAGQRFHFDLGESIHTENSYKYGLLRIQAMASAAGWSQRQMWTDAHASFGVHVFERME